MEYVYKIFKLQLNVLANSSGEEIVIFCKVNCIRDETKKRINDPFLKNDFICIFILYF